MKPKDRDQSPQPQSAGAAGKESPGQQTQDSRQSANQPGSGDRQRAGKPSESKAGIGSSQGQDKAASDEGAIFGAGTADIERAKAGTRDAERDSAGSQDSMVNDPTGAFKERP